MAYEIQECWFYHGPRDSSGRSRLTVSHYGYPFGSVAKFAMDEDFWYERHTKDIVNDDRFHPAIHITFNAPTISKLMEEIDEYVTNTNPKEGLHRDTNCTIWWFRPWWNPESNSFEEIFFHRVE